MATTESPKQIDESPKLKAFYLKVPIQCACEGCKKKVKRILFKVQGVDSVDVDIKQQKVTVTGDVKAEALIKKLAKHGKEARIWPENTVRQHKNVGKDKNKEKQSDLETSKPATVHGGDKDVKPPEKVIAATEESVKVGGEGSSGVDAKDAREITGGGADGEKTKSEGKKPETGSGGNQQKSADNVSSESDTVVEKKKAKGGQKGNKTTAGAGAGAGEPSNGGAPAHTGSRNNISDLRPANHSPPRHQGYQLHHQAAHFTPATPAYAVSYNTANPGSSHTASFYSQPPPYSYAYSHAEPPYLPSYPYQMQQAPALDHDAYRGQPLDSFEMLSDENPNGCFIM
jgi:copper chaperone CopZ